jgi:hypothetical protein
VHTAATNTTSHHQHRPPVRCQPRCNPTREIDQGHTSPKQPARRNRSVVRKQKLSWCHVSPSKLVAQHEAGYLRSVEIAMTGIRSGGR